MSQFTQLKYKRRVFGESWVSRWPIGTLVALMSPLLNTVQPKSNRKKEKKKKFKNLNIFSGTLNILSFVVDGKFTTDDI